MVDILLLQWSALFMMCLWENILQLLNCHSISTAVVLLSAFLVLVAGRWFLGVSALSSRILLPRGQDQQRAHDAAFVSCWESVSHRNGCLSWWGNQYLCPGILLSRREQCKKPQSGMMTILAICVVVYLTVLFCRKPNHVQTAHMDISQAWKDWKNVCSVQRENTVIRMDSVESQVQ